MITIAERPSATAPSAQSRPAEAVVSLRGISKSFPVHRRLSEIARHPFRREQTPVVRDVSCDVHRGEFFGLLGPNGAGKTTLFRILSTSVIPDTGTAHVAGFDVLRDPRSVRRHVAPVMTDERSLNWRLSAEENLKLFAALHGYRGAARSARVRQALENVELADAGEKLVAKFSSGMKQRLLIARALLGDPSVLLLDEPTRSLDPISARRFRDFLRTELVDKRGCTVLLATHSSEEALDLCDRVGVLHRGRLLAVGTANQIAAEIQAERYRIYTRTPDHAAFASLADRGWISPLGAPRPDTGPWAWQDFEIRGGEEAAANVLSALAEAGVPIASFERLKLPLADLIERVVQRHAREDDHA